MDLENLNQAKDFVMQEIEERLGLTEGMLKKLFSAKLRQAPNLADINHYQLKLVVIY
jgi:hypothetical protein